MAWSRLIRFVDTKGFTSFGEPCIEHAEDLVKQLESQTLYALRLEGSDPFALSAPGEKVQVQSILEVLKPTDVPIIKCIGLNYMKHIAEGGRKPPPFPSLFIKSSPCLAKFDEDVIIPKIAQGKNLDYEGELSVVIGKTGKNISPEDALEYVAGFTPSNDVSARTWQKDPAYAGGVPQWCYAKGFDKFAPIGPMLVSPSVVGAADNLRLETFVNGELRQDTSTDDLLFNVRAIVSFLSQGSTLEKGTVIMTGTPAGVAMGMAEPKWLQNGDVVEVKIEHLGSCINKIVYE